MPRVPVFCFDSSENKEFSLDLVHRDIFDFDIGISARASTRDHRFASVIIVHTSFFYGGRHHASTAAATATTAAATAAAAAESSTNRMQQCHSQDERDTTGFNNRYVAR